MGQWLGVGGVYWWVRGRPEGTETTPAALNNHQAFGSSKLCLAGGCKRERNLSRQIPGRGKGARLCGRGAAGAMVGASGKGSVSADPGRVGARGEGICLGKFQGGRV